MGNRFGYYFGMHAHVATYVATNLSNGFHVWPLFLHLNLEKCREREYVGRQTGRRQPLDHSRCHSDGGVAIDTTLIVAVALEIECYERGGNMGTLKG